MKVFVELIVEHAEMKDKRCNSKRMIVQMYFGQVLIENPKGLAVLNVQKRQTEYSGAQKETKRKMTGHWVRKSISSLITCKVSAAEITTPLGVKIVA